MIQKQPPEVFYKKRCSKKFHRKTPVLESSFIKVAGLGSATLDSKTGVFLLNLRNSQKHIFCRASANGSEIHLLLMVVKVMLVKMMMTVTMKVQKQSFADILQNRDS